MTSDIPNDGPIDQGRDDEGDRFLATAVSQGLLRENHLEKILVYANEHDTHPSDAALSLSMLQQHEVEAIKMLCYPTKLAPGYELTGLIGCGAGGMVFRAHQTALDRDVALKTINPQSKSASVNGEPRIQREAHAIAKLRHPGIVAAYDSGFFQGRFCIAMELVEGESLAKFIRRESPVPEHVAWEIARQVACALSHACDAGIIHRDIKPANLLLCKPPTGTNLPEGVPCVKVADFGLASLEDQATQITATGATLGTPSYVSPEQLQDPHVDARADIYSLGATVFEMLCGHAPCYDQSAMKTIMQKTIGDDRWRDELDSNVSPGTLKLFREMTEADPANRTPDYETLIKRIDQVLHTLAPNSNGGSGEFSFDATIEYVGESKEVSAQPSKTTKSLGWKKAVIPVVVLLFLTTVAYGLVNHFINTDGIQQAEESAIEWVPDGFAQQLFNGTSVPLKFRSSNGWTPTEIEDGSRVLAGKEGAMMTIPLTLADRPSQDLRFRVGINLDPESSAEIGLIFSHPGSPSPAEHASIRLANGIADLVITDKDSPEIIAASVPLNQSDKNSSMFQSLVLIQHPNNIEVLVDHQPLGSLERDPSSASSAVLKCTAGVANFADIDMVPLKPVAPADSPNN